MTPAPVRYATTRWQRTDFGRPVSSIRFRTALVHSTGPGVVGWSSLSGSERPMPHKHNADRRHHIPKMAFKVRNWPAYEAGLRRRGSLTLWIEDAALDGRGQGGTGSAHTARPPSGDDHGPRPTGLAGRHRLRSAFLSRNDDGPLQSADRPRLRARGFAVQQAEAAIGVTVLNRMLLTGPPKSVRCQRVVA